jgi:hypothetical protein
MNIKPWIINCIYSNILPYCLHNIYYYSQFVDSFIQKMNIISWSFYYFFKDSFFLNHHLSFLIFKGYFLFFMDSFFLFIHLFYIYFIFSSTIHYFPIFLLNILEILHLTFFFLPTTSLFFIEFFWFIHLNFYYFSFFIEQEQI